MTLAGETSGAKPRARRRTAIPRPEPQALLAWYDRERRDLPWRAPPGRLADPYRVWLSEIMLQQTRVETVARYYERFLERFPTVQQLAAAPLDHVLRLWAGLGYYARARNLHACAREIVNRHGGKFPPGETELRALPGIGAYTAAAISAIAFGRKAAPVDGNIERVIARLYAIETPMPAAKAELRRLMAALVPEKRAGDFAQAMMDLGTAVCTPKRPDCPRCPWHDACSAFRDGNSERYPLRPPKTEGRLRRGAAFVVLREDRAVLLRRRAPNGLLGGMTEVPNTEWTPAFKLADMRKAATLLIPSVREEAWRRLPAKVRHVFTHFRLELTVFVAAAPKSARASRGMRFVPVAKLDGEALPTLMRKVITRAVHG
jgi:A/G-specific adenine glycosylase